MSKNLHILSEKPVAMTSLEAESLIAAYHQRRIERPSMGLWHVAENYRLEPAIMYARDLVQTRISISPPKTFSLIALRQQSPTAKYAATSWRKEPKYRGSFVLDGGIHFVAMLRAVLGGSITGLKSTYKEDSVVECGVYGSCRVGEAMGTFHIQYGAFESPVCRFDVYFSDAVLSISQIKGVGYEVSMSQREVRTFPFEGVQNEFSAWLDSVAGKPIATLQPEEGLIDLQVVERMIGSSDSRNE